MYMIFNLINMFIISLLIIMIMMFINLLTQKKFFFNREKNSPFECGFDPLSNSRLPFSINFFLISLIFLIFDVEITLIMPIIFSFYKINMYMMLSFYLFLLILLLGLYIEWMESNLNWLF